MIKLFAIFVVAVTLSSPVRAEGVDCKPTSHDRMPLMPEKIDKPFTEMGFAPLEQMVSLEEAWVWNGMDQLTMARATMTPEQLEDVSQWLLGNGFVATQETPADSHACTNWTDLLQNVKTSRKFVRQAPGQEDSIYLMEYDDRRPAILMYSFTL